MHVVRRAPADVSTPPPPPLLTLPPRRSVRLLRRVARIASYRILAAAGSLLGQPRVPGSLLALPNVISVCFRVVPLYTV